MEARLSNCVQLSTDGHTVYFEAVEDAFGGQVAYAQVVKNYRSRLYSDEEEEAAEGERYLTDEDE